MSIVDWFHLDVLRWKSFSSLFWTCSLQFLWLFLLSPFLSRYSPLFSLLSPGSWIYDLLVISALWGTRSDYEGGFSVVPYVKEGPWGTFRRGCGRAVSLLSHVAVGGLLTRCYLTLSGHTGLGRGFTKSCDGSPCLNDAYVFITLSGCYFGAYQWYDYHFKNGNLLRFPLIDLKKKSRIRSRLPFVIKESALAVFLSFRWFLLFYVIYGSTVHTFVSRLFRLTLHHQRNVAWTAYFANLLRLSLYAWIYDTLLLSTLKTLQSILNAYYTEPLSFSTDAEEERSIVEAMDPKLKSPLLRHLAFRDFASLASDQSPGRRAALFALSQPGGHPRNWNKLSSQCERAIDDFLRDLSSATQPAEKPAEKKPDTKADYFLTTPDLRMRRLVDEPPLSSSTPLYKPASGVQDIQRTSGVVSRALKKMEKTSIFSILPDSAIRNVFAEHSAILMWIVEGLSHLVANSVQEDRFGVIQKDLPNILSLLLNLQQIIERHKGMTVNLRKNKNEAKDLQLKNELRNTVKLSLYRISVAYGDSLSFVPGLSLDFQQKLKNYNSFME